MYIYNCSLLTKQCCVLEKERADIQQIRCFIILIIIWLRNRWSLFWPKCKSNLKLFVQVGLCLIAQFWETYTPPHITACCLCTASRNSWTLVQHSAEHDSYTIQHNRMISTRTIATSFLQIFIFLLTAHSLSHQERLIKRTMVSWESWPTTLKCDYVQLWSFHRRILVEYS